MVVAVNNKLSVYEVRILNINVSNGGHTIDWLIDWLIDWQNNWLIDWLICINLLGFYQFLNTFLILVFRSAIYWGIYCPSHEALRHRFTIGFQSLWKTLCQCGTGWHRVHLENSRVCHRFSVQFSLASSLTWFGFPLVSVLNSGTASDPQAVTCQGRIEDMIFAGADASYSFLVTVGADHTCRVIRPELYFILVESFFCHWKSFWNLISRCTTVRPLVTGPLGRFSSAGRWLPWLRTSRWPTWPFPMRLAPFSVFPSSLRYFGRSFSVSLLFLWILLWKVSRDFFRCWALQDSRSSHPNLLSESDWNQRYHLSGHSWVHGTFFTASVQSGNVSGVFFWVEKRLVVYSSAVTGACWCPDLTI